MKKILIVLTLFSTLFMACDPQIDDKIDIGGPPANVDFTITPSSTPNRYILTNTTPDVFQYFWDLGTGETATGREVEAYYPLKGNYTISLTVFGEGGSASTEKQLNVAEDAPFDCESDQLYKFFTDCSERTWKIKPVPGSLWVGPGDGSGTTWWAIPEADISARPCAFNDEWTFTKDGQMIYDTKGDVFGEPYMGFDFECVDETALGPDKAPWGDGTHNFELIEGSPNKLKVVGLGAFLGIPKAANGAEVTDPQTAVTYDIRRWEMVDGKREFEIQVNFGPGIWRFIYVEI